VLELGRFIAVPVCAQLLAEGGADVIKVEDIDGDQTRHNQPILPFEGRQFFNKNRGKRSLSVKLNDPDVIRGVRELAARSDVVLANFRPGLSEKLGLDYTTVSRANPRIIYAENTAYGLHGPMAETAGMDIVIQAYTGLAQITDRGPEQLENPMIDYTASLLMAFGVSTALFHRERTGRGQKLDTALLHAAMFMENNQLTHVDAIDGWRDEFVAYLKHAFADGQTWADVLRQRLAVSPHRVMRAYYGFFQASDGTVAVACNARTLRLAMIDALGIEDRWTTEPGWEPDDVDAHEQAVWDQVVAAFASAPVSHWISEFSKRGLPIGPVRHSDQLFYDEQISANGFLTRVEHELIGGITIVAPPIQFADSPMAARPPVPLGKHSREALREGGLDDATIDRLVAAGAVREFTTGAAK
jgi:crotonobetainyl-CoA:carnitine CoA-transferase CaiB-like acyl-CoA transferase